MSDNIEDRHIHEAAALYLQRRQHKKDQMREYYLANLDAFRAYQRNYHIVNVDKIKERNRAYYLANTERISRNTAEYAAAHPEMKLLSQKKHYWNHKEAINEWQCTKVKCGCGGKYTLSNKAQHFRSRKHERHHAE